MARKRYVEPTGLLRVNSYASCLIQNFASGANKLMMLETSCNADWHLLEVLLFLMSIGDSLLFQETCHRKTRPRSPFHTPAVVLSRKWDVIILLHFYFSVRVSCMVATSAAKVKESTTFYHRIARQFKTLNFRFDVSFSIAFWISASSEIHKRHKRLAVSFCADLIWPVIVHTGDIQ